MSDVGFIADRVIVEDNFTPVVKGSIYKFRKTSGNVSLSEDRLTASNTAQAAVTDFAESFSTVDIDGTERGFYFTLDKSQFQDGDQIAIGIIDDEVAPSVAYFAAFSYDQISDNFIATAADLLSGNTSLPIDLDGDVYDGEEICFSVTDQGDLSIKIGGTPAAPAFEVGHSGSSAPVTSGLKILTSWQFITSPALIDMTLIENPVEFDSVTLITNPATSGELQNPPEDRENRIFRADSMPAPVIIDGVGVVENGDLVYFDFDGNASQKISSGLVCANYAIDWMTGEIVDLEDVTSPSGNMNSDTRSVIPLQDVLTPNGDFLSDYFITELYAEFYSVNGDGGWTVNDGFRTEGSFSNLVVGLLAGQLDENLVIQSGADGLAFNLSAYGGDLLGSIASGKLLDAPARIRIKACRI